MAARRAPANYALLFPYALPYFAYVIGVSRGRDLLGDSGGYALAAAAAIGALLWGARWYLPLRGPRAAALSVAVGTLGGILGTVLWVALKRPFLDADGDVLPWEPRAFWWRLGVSALVVPFVEELLFRGLVLRGATQWLQERRSGRPDPLGRALHERSINDLSPGVWTGFGLIFSSLVFAAGHAPGEWIAATAYGLLMGALVIWRGDLLGAVVAHGVTNATLALYVRETAQWSLW